MELVESATKTHICLNIRHMRKFISGLSVSKKTLDLNKIKKKCRYPDSICTN